MRNRTFLRYIVSYALVLVLPLMALFLFFDRAMIRRYEEELAAEDSSLLLQLRDTMDADLQQLFNLAYAIQNTPSLNPKNIGEDILARRQAIAQLGAYHSIATLPETLIVYRSGDDVCYTGTTTISPEKLFGQQLVYASHTAEDFRRTVDEKSSMVVWPVDSVAQYGGQTADCLTLFISVGAGDVRPKQRTVYVIPVRRLVDRIQSLSGVDASVRITTADGMPLLTVGQADFSALPDGAAADGARVSLGGREYALSGTASRLTGWRYTVLRPLDRLEGPLRSYRRRVAILMVLTMLAGGAVIYALSWRNYRPIRHLAEKARAYAPDKPAGSEMEQVEAVLDSLSEESQTYRSRLENSTESLRQNCLTRLLADPDHGAELLSELRGYNALTDPEARCRVVVIAQKSRLAAWPTEAQVGELMAGSLEITDALVCETPPDRDLQAVILQYGGGAEGNPEEILLFRSRMEEETGLPVSLGVSLCLPAVRLAEAYQQAVQASRMRLVHGKGVAVFYSPQAQTAVSLQDYPVQELEALQWHLLQMDRDSVHACLDRITAGLRREPISFELVRMVCYDAVNVTVRTLMSMREKARPEMSSELLERLLRFESVQELMAGLEAFIDQAFREAARTKENEADHRAEALKQYVRENCLSSDFSLQMAADHFGLTPSNLSHYFKNCTGMGLSEYVQEIRRTEACRLLAETDDPIQEVGRQVGMPNVSSFIRSFKQQTGFTPGQYRLKHARDTDQPK